MRRFALNGFGAAALCLSIASSCSGRLQASADETMQTILIIVDSSSSMAEKTENGERKLDVVKESLASLLEGMSTDMYMGLLVFGHRNRRIYGDKDIEMVIPIGPLNAEVVKGAVDTLRPNGLSPLSASLEKAAESLVHTEGNSIILLLTDGKETCGGDPVAMAAEIKDDMGISVIIDVVGLNVSDVVKEELKKIAGAGGGTYYSVKNMEEVSSTVERAVRNRVHGPDAASKKHGKRKHSSGKSRRSLILGSDKMVTEELPTGLSSSRKEGPGDVALYYDAIEPRSISIYDQETNALISGSGMWVHIENCFRTSLEPGVYKLEIERKGGREPVVVKNVIVRSSRRTSVNLD